MLLPKTLVLRYLPFLVLNYGILLLSHLWKLFYVLDYMLLEGSGWIIYF